MNGIDFINTNYPLNLEQEFGNGYIIPIPATLMGAGGEVPPAYSPPFPVYQITMFA
ncbi:hypothetical protein [Wolbachia endosymbiont of Cantharis cryptica]|uniref:hypothetical protein n=1 Tax=Wolbachia endosymbiont of Cantharis cryptica TaxID=3066132 RepID=UPI00376EA10E